MLAGQRVLLIGIGFYDYEAAIAAEMQALGALVTVENEQPPAMRGWLAPVRRRLHTDLSGALRRHHAAILERVRTTGPIDHILVVKGALLDADFLAALRAAQPRAQLIAYHWDSMARFPALLARQALFDRVLTFDHADAAAHRDFILRPLFFRPEMVGGEQQVQDIDLAFVGWLHHDRLRQVEAIRTQAAAQGLRFEAYLSTGRWTRTKLRLAGRGTDVHARAQSFADYAALTRRARVIVDLPHPQQTGLTMRAIETVGAGRKLITTAAGIDAYDFYRPENIARVDASSPLLDAAFIAAPHAPLPPDLVHRYTLRAWVLDVLGLTAPAVFLDRRRGSGGHAQQAVCAAAVEA